jgi:hypothetical protein
VRFAVGTGGVVFDRIRRWVRPIERFCGDCRVWWSVLRRGTFGRGGIYVTFGEKRWIRTVQATAGWASVAVEDIVEVKRSCLLFEGRKGRGENEKSG